MVRFLLSLLALAVAALFARADCGSYCPPAGRQAGYARVAVEAPCDCRHVDLYDGDWHFHPAGWFRGYWFPAGTYRWCDGRWHLRGYGYFRGFTSVNHGW